MHFTEWAPNLDFEGPKDMSKVETCKLLVQWKTDTDLGFRCSRGYPFKSRLGILLITTVRTALGPANLKNSMPINHSSKYRYCTTTSSNQIRNCRNFLGSFCYQGKRIIEKLKQIKSIPGAAAAILSIGTAADATIGKNLNEDEHGRSDGFKVLHKSGVILIRKVWNHDQNK